MARHCAASFKYSNATDSSGEMAAFSAHRQALLLQSSAFIAGSFSKKPQPKIA
jgi:hypothetical protein